MSKAEDLHVRDAMKDCCLIDGLSSVRKALEIMERTGENTLIIDKRDERDEYGVITMQMIAREIFAKSLNPQRMSVYQVMVKPALTLHAGMQVRYAIRLLARLGTEMAIVSEADHMVGWVDQRTLSLAEFRYRFPENDD